MDKYIECMIKVILTIVPFILLVCLVGLSQELEQNRYDVNGDGIVNASDYVAVKNYIMEES